MRRLLCILLALVLFLCILLPLSALPYEQSALAVLPEAQVPATVPPAVSAASFALLDPQSGKLLASKDPDARRPMASTTKIMTALVVLEQCDLGDIVTVPREAVGIEGSSIYLFEGEQISVESLLYGLMLSSANDAAVALALHTAGSVEGFAALMNRKAIALGLTDTHFCNPHGLHDEAHYTTARELAQITAAAMQNEIFAKIVSTKRHSALQQGTDASRLFLNHNRLLRQFEGAIGVKTGYTKAGGRCLVSAARRDGMTLIAVTLNAPDDWRDHTALLEWGFSQYISFAPAPEVLTLPVVGGTASTVTLSQVGKIALTLPASHPEVACTVELPRFLYGGFEKGKSVGRIIYRMGDEVLGELPLITDAAVEREPPFTLLQKFRNLFH